MRTLHNGDGNSSRHPHKNNVSAKMIIIDVAVSLRNNSVASTFWLAKSVVDFVLEAENSFSKLQKR